MRGKSKNKHASIYSARCDISSIAASCFSERASAVLNHKESLLTKTDAIQTKRWPSHFTVGIGLHLFWEICFENVEHQRGRIISDYFRMDCLKCKQSNMQIELEHKYLELIFLWRNTPWTEAWTLSHFKVLKEKWAHKYLELTFIAPHLIYLLLFAESAKNYGIHFQHKQFGITQCQSAGETE